MPRSHLEWNAVDYHRLASPHVGWGRKVLQRLTLRGDETVLDAGCGSGRLTAELLELLPDGRVIAVDVSANMLAEAARNLEPVAGERVTFLQSDLQHLTLDEPVDAIFSTAALHWVRDHPLLFERLFTALKPGGWLVAQCGGGPNIAGVRERAAALMASPPFVAYFLGWSGPWEFASDEETALRLERAGFEQIATSLEPSLVALAGYDEYRDYLETVVFGAHLERLPSTGLRRQFVTALADQSAADAQPFTLDYWRLNMRARRPG
jgi:ubiquinone/menaquinone biosynthesis C-methylase UbiE